VGDAAKVYVLLDPILRSGLRSGSAGEALACRILLMIYCAGTSLLDESRISDSLHQRISRSVHLRACLRRSSDGLERAPLLTAPWASRRVMVLIAAQRIMASDRAGSRS
jgi:hypothetical protein